MFKSFFNWKVGVNFLLAIGLFMLLVFGVFRWLESYTNHGKEVPVPNVIDMPVHEAVKVLENMGLAVEVDSFKYEPKYKPFQVLEAYPTAGSRVKEGRVVVLKVNPRTWAKVELPDVLDKYKGLAFSRLELVGLKVGDTIYEANIQKDAVIRMEINGNEIKPGTLLSKFSTVDLIIGTGPMRNIRVPNVVGLTVKEARAVIKRAHFELGVIDFYGEKDEQAIVYYQDPDRGALRDQGMEVDIWASNKTPAEMKSKIDELNEMYRRSPVIIDEPNTEMVDDFVEKQNDTEIPPPRPKKQVSNTQNNESKTVEKKENSPKKPENINKEKPNKDKVVIE